MAKDNIIGLAMGLDTSSLKAGLNDARRQIRNASAEFSAATSGMDDWTKSSEGLQAKIKQLTKTLNVQEQALALLEKEYKDTYEGQNENSAAAINLRTKILNQQAAVNKTARELKNYETTLQQAEDGTIDLEQATLKGGKAIQKMEDATEKADGGFTVLKGTIAGLLTNGISKLVSGFANATRNALALAESTREYREDLGKLETAFEAANKSTEVANKTYQEFYKVLGEEDRSVEAVSHLAEFVETEEDMVKWTNIAAGVTGKFGDSLPIEGLTEASNETAKVGKVTGVLADALNWAGISEDQFNEKLEKLNSEEERAALITNTLNKAYTESASHYRENNAEVMKARGETIAYKDTQAELGAKMEEVNSALLKVKTAILETILANVDFEEVSKQVSEILNKFVTDVLPKIVDGFKWMIQHLPEIIHIVATLGSTFLALKIASIVTSIVKAIKTWTVATKGMTIAQKALNLVMKANPIGLIITAVMALISAIVYLWNTNEDFRNAVIKIWEGIKKAFSVAVEFIKQIFQKGLEFIKNYFTFYINLYKNIWNALVSFFTNLWNGIKNIFSSVGQWFTNVFTSAKNGIVNAFNSVLGFFKNLWRNIQNVFRNVGSFFGGIWNTIKSKFADIGQKIGSSIAGAFKKAINAVLKTAEKVLNAPINAINGLLDKIRSVVNIPKLSTFKLPRLAKGGIVNKATLGIFGEAGTEAVIPLERNLGWLKQLAGQLVSEMQNTNGSISNINNSTNTNFTQIINAPKQPPIDELYRRTGNLIDLSKVVTQ